MLHGQSLGFSPDPSLTKQNTYQVPMRLHNSPSNTSTITLLKQSVFTHDAEATIMDCSCMEKAASTKDHDLRHLKHSTDKNLEPNFPELLEAYN